MTPPEQRASRYGLVGAAFGIGFVVGPAVGGLLASIDLRLPFWVAAAFSLANTLYGFFVLPESLPPENRRPFRWKAAHPLGALEFVRQIENSLRNSRAYPGQKSAPRSLDRLCSLAHRRGSRRQQLDPGRSKSGSPHHPAESLAHRKGSQGHRADSTRKRVCPWW